MTYRTHWIVFAMFLPLFLVTAVVEAQPTRTPTPLPPLVDTPGSTATGISSGGVVVGASLGFPFTVGPYTMAARAIVWDRRGIPAPLPLLAGDVANTATGISANGKSIIGLSFHPGDPGGCPRCGPGDPRGGEMSVTTAVIWGPDGTPAPLPPLPGDTQSIANAISPAGVVVGASLAIEATSGARLPRSTPPEWSSGSVQAAGVKRRWCGTGMHSALGSQCRSRPFPTTRRAGPPASARAEWSSGGVTAAMDPRRWYGTATASPRRCRPWSATGRVRPPESTGMGRSSGTAALRPASTGIRCLGRRWCGTATGFPRR